MNKDYDILKVNYGERFAKLCRNLFPTILENDGVLSDLMLSHFASSHFLYDDIINNDIDGFRNYIYSFTNIEIKRRKTNKSVKELMSDAGYEIYECHTEEDIQKFKKYYQSGEELCTFRGGRLDDCYVFFAVKKNVNEIRREDFKSPKRQDEYGTSVISIQFSRGSINTLSIKNRYNHTVGHPDATFSNNLENIIPGLTDAFEREYHLNINQTESQDFELENYVLANDRRYYRYNYEINNIYYCSNNIIIDGNRNVIEYDHEKYLVMDYFIVDLKMKTISLYDESLKDSFIDSFQNIEKIKVEGVKENKIITVTEKDKEDVIIEINKYGQIIKLEDKNLVSVGDYFMSYSNYLQNLNLPNLESVGNWFLSGNISLKVLILPSLVVAGDWFLYSNESLKIINLPSLVSIGNCFLNNNNSLQNLNLPNLESVGHSFLYWNMSLRVVDFPSLVSVGDEFLYCNNSLRVLSLPSLESVGDSFFRFNKDLSEINAPNLERVGDFFLSNNLKLRELDLPNLKFVRDYFLCDNTMLERIYLPSLENFGDWFLVHVQWHKSGNFIERKDVILELWKIKRKARKK